MRFHFWALALAVLTLDQWTKSLAVKHLAHESPVPLVGRALYLTYVQNTGTAFGLLSGAGAYLVAIAVLAVVFIVGYWGYLGRRSGPPNPWLTCGLALPLGGAIGNLIDRIRLGYVVDFIDFRVWPVFNVADSAITVGAFLIGYYYFFRHDERAANDQPTKGPPATSEECVVPDA
jgi:signal peptidase II